uniref:G protein-regulated inducer of neurite outgrowth C-terminal domain-containing protein n=1 Tax=Mola mola TaxID=94237 RepID=A0A3Q3WBV0_MOLML
MGSVEDEMRGVGEKAGERAADGDGAGGSDGSAAPETPQINTSPAADRRPHTNGSHAEDRDVDPVSKELSGGVRDNADQSDPIGVRQSAQTVAVPQIRQINADQATAATRSKTTSDSDAGDGIHVCGDKSPGSDKENENIQVWVPLTPGPSDPRSPAPVGQHHMRTQVSLEMVQCHSVATSPMTPPDSGHAFLFPSALGRSTGSDAKDAELQVGHQVEFCSVATSPMTPKTPSTTAFPELIGRELAQRSEELEKSGQQEAGLKETGQLTYDTSEDPQVALVDRNQHCEQQRLRAVDQTITITVTHYNDEEEASSYHTQSDTVKIDEREQVGGSISDAKGGDGKENMSTESVAPARAQNTSSPPPQHTGEVSACDETRRDAECEEGAKPPVPESPAPFGCHNIRTQVSLEVVQCQSVATSPMTPPDGDQAFCFPSSLRRCAAAGAESRDPQLQVDTRVEFRSVATAPMTPRTAAAAEEDTAEARHCEEKGDEPVQEVSWDEKGMTWEVYGAVVEVAVLGSAIQKHLEKQVMKKRQPSMPPPPPLMPSATPLSPESLLGGSGTRRERDGEVSRRRRNPFRLMMENMQQPHCCSRAYTTE